MAGRVDEKINPSIHRARHRVELCWSLTVSWFTLNFQKLFQLVSGRPLSISRVILFFSPMFILSFFIFLIRPILSIITIVGNSVEYMLEILPTKWPKGLQAFLSDFVRILPSCKTSGGFFQMRCFSGSISWYLYLCKIMSINSVWR